MPQLARAPHASLLAAILASASPASSDAVRPAPSSSPLHLQVPKGYTIERVAGPEHLSYPMFGAIGARPSTVEQVGA